MQDDLAADGVELFAIGILTDGPCSGCACIELPAFARVTEFLACLDAVGRGAAQAGVPSLLIQGFPPPVDARISWTTITPDPAVIEVNQAPYPDATRFLTAMRELHSVAEGIGLSPYRLQFTGKGPTLSRRKMPIARPSTPRLPKKQAPLWSRSAVARL